MSGRLCRGRRQPHEFDCALLATFHDSNLLWRCHSFVARDARQCVGKRTAVERGDGDWIVVLRPVLAPEFQPYTCVGADLVDGVVQGEHLFGCYPNPALLEQPYRKSSSAQNRDRRKRPIPQVVSQACRKFESDSSWLQIARHHCLPKGAQAVDRRYTSGRV
jgi:hypothetical protein